jgi:hypothetical protein
VCDYAGVKLKLRNACVKLHSVEFRRSVEEGHFFAAIAARADARHRQAREAFEQAGGRRLRALTKQVS